MEIKKTVTLNIFIILLLLNYVSLEKECNTQQNSIECYECNSYENSNCAINPDEIKSVRKCDTCEPCVTAIAEGITYRTCLSKLASYTKRISLDLKYVNNCTTNHCNNKIYPPNRLRCYKCSEGIDCVNGFNRHNNDNSKAIPCLYFKEYDRCFTDIIDEIDAVRGCESDGNYTFGYGIQLCDQSECNNQFGIITSNCIQCSSETSRGCKRPVISIDNINNNNNNNNDDDDKKCKIYENNNCTINYLLGRQEESCFVYHKLDTVIRGCTKLNAPLRTESEYFKECKGDFCNKNCLEMLKCYTCDSENDPNCKFALNDSHLMSCTSEDSSCYTCQLEGEGGNIIRGCGKPQFESDNCYQCSDRNGCNEKSIKKCYNCTSEFDPDCIDFKNNKNMYQQICPMPSDSCVTFVKNNGHVYRGCLSKYFNCNYNTKCEECDENLCNSNIFPKNRIKCYQCTGNIKSNDECAKDQNNYNNDDNSNSEYSCPIYQNDDKCIAYIDYENDIVYRGCLSDNIEERNKCELLNEKCIKCNDKSLCNNQNLVHLPKLSCAKCNFSMNSTCIWAQKNYDIKKCTKDVPFYLKESCFTYINDDDDDDNNNKKNNMKFLKGCKLDEEICGDNSSESQKYCQYCTDSDGCNKKNFIKQNCTICNSNQTLKCLKEPNLYFSVCEKTNITYNQRGCYTKKINDGKGVLRGCAVDLQPHEFEKCKNFNGSNTDNSFCEYCDTNDCNVIQVNESNKLYSSIIFTFFCILSREFL